MRLYSTRESSQAGEISLLAIVETLVCSTASFWVAIHYDTWWHMLIPACFAPLSLMRTDESSAAAIRYYTKIANNC